MEKDRLKELFTGYLNDSLSKDKLVELQQLMLEGDSDAFLDPVLKAAFQQTDFAEDDRTAGTIVWNNLRKGIQKEQRFRLQKWYYRMAVAASVVLVLGFGGYFYSQLKKDKHPTAYLNDVAPGTQGATLTLGNGKKIKLSDAADGELAREAEVVVTKSADGQLIYEIKSIAKANGPVAFNTLTTSNGETYQVKLPDGTMVWLNSASVLTYPVSFAANKHRQVHLAGEGYFEVTKDKAHPFIVTTAQEQVEVLGTHFNINSYADEASTKTTLLEGAVKVNNLKPGKVKAAGDEVLLKPGQQSILGIHGLSVRQADVDLELAWRNGFFSFDQANLEQVMRQVTRWYNVTVVYQSPELRRKRFSGEVSRYDQVSGLLSAIEKTGVVRFEITGKTIFVNK